MSDDTLAHVIIAGVLLAVAIHSMGYFWGVADTRKACADAAISGRLADWWWLEALIDARARKAKKALRAQP